MGKGEEATIPSRHPKKQARVAASVSTDILLLFCTGNPCPMPLSTPSSSRACFCCCVAFAHKIEAIAETEEAAPRFPSFFALMMLVLSQPISLNHTSQKQEGRLEGQRRDSLRLPGRGGSRGAWSSCAFHLQQ